MRSPDEYGYVVANNICLFQKGPLSQWYGAYKGQDSRFRVIEHHNYVCGMMGLDYGVEFNCCEQWMMACKARLFDDLPSYRAIMATTDPKKQKELGRGIKGYIQGRWDKWKTRIVLQGNLFKFNQNEEIREFLLNFNRNTLFAEAAPWDNVWGIGLGPDDPKALDINEWRGENLLGEVIRQVRRSWT